MIHHFYQSLDDIYIYIWDPRDFDPNTIRKILIKISWYENCIYARKSEFLQSRNVSYNHEMMDVKLFIPIYLLFYILEIDIKWFSVFIYGVKYY